MDCEYTTRLCSPHTHECVQKRYDELSHAIRWYKHLHMLKRAGRGHDPNGVEATRFGALAIESPAAPHPGKNLPVGWELNEKQFVVKNTLQCLGQLIMA
jgi:hypothetical protein